MPDLVPAFRTSDAAVHTSYIAALKHELLMWLKEVSENEVGAKKIVDSLTAESIGGITEMFQAIQVELAEPAKFEVTRNGNTVRAEG